MVSEESLRDLCIVGYLAGTSCLGSFLDSFGLSCVDEIHFSIMVLFLMLNVYLGIISPETYFICTY